jgi:hypothetical protein
MSKITIQQMADRVSALIEQRLKVSGGSLEMQVSRAGTRLPRPVRAAAEALVQAVQMAQQPKLIMQIDDQAVAVAYDICLRHLNGVDPAKRRKGLLLDLAARIAFALLMVGVLLVGVLYWRGFI